MAMLLAGSKLLMVTLMNTLNFEVVEGDVVKVDPQEAVELKEGVPCD